MGVRATLSEIEAELFSQLVSGAEPKIAWLADHSIDKAWYDFHLLFRAKGSPLNLAIAGDSRHPQSPHSLDEFCAGGHEYYVGLMSPRLVKELAAVLENMSVSDYKRCESELVDNCYNCGETFFPELKAAYLQAAAHKNALMIVIC